MTPDGSKVAASSVGLDANGKPADASILAIWDALTGLETFRTTAQLTTDIALAPDGTLLAAGHEDGRISLWTLPEGERTVTLKSDRNQINCLLFGRDPVRRQGPKGPGAGWLLAAGDQGGGVVIWDPLGRVPRSICLGPTNPTDIVLALAFSPDGMTLASTGRRKVSLWDVASGQFLLEIPGQCNYSIALAFSPDGSRLAVGGYGPGKQTFIVELDPGRGIDGLRGLSRAVMWMTFSPDGRLVGALSTDWHVGIWDRTSRRLLHVLEVTPGFFTDNAALAFSQNGTQFGFSAGQEASLWDTKTGKVIKSWRLPSGLTDQMAFPEPGRLLLFRTETESGDVGPFPVFDARKYPRVCRVRDLLGKEPLEPLAEIRDCNLHVFHAACSPDGRYYAVEGKGGSLEWPTRIANLYEGPSGKKLESLPTQNLLQPADASFIFDPTGTVMNYLYKAGKDGDRSYFLSVPSLAVVQQFDRMLAGLGPRAERWLMGSDDTADQPGALTLCKQGRPNPLVGFLLDSGNVGAAGKPRFSPDGRHIVWGNPRGVKVVDLVEVNRRLGELGLGW